MPEKRSDRDVTHQIMAELAFEKRSDRDVTHQIMAELASERYVVKRIGEEMNARGWSQSELSRRMEIAARDGSGGVLHQTALSRILRGKGRHISIEQLVTLSRIFGVPLVELLLPRAALGNARGWRYLLEAGELQNEIRHMSHRYNERIIDVQPMMQDSPELVERVREYGDALRSKLSQELKDDRPGGPRVEDLMANRLNRYPILLAIEDALKLNERRRRES